MEFREYTAADRGACLEIFDSNARRYFAPGDREQYERFLDAPGGFYGVLCDDAGRIVGCGGCATDAADVGVLTWGMIHADLHGRGLGRRLTEFRLRRLREVECVRRIELNTCQLTAGFYLKMGFRVERTTPDGFMPGLDRIDMAWETGPAAALD